MLFDGYIMVDWSAASKKTTGADSIWVAELLGDKTQIKFVNHPTRTEAREYLKDKMTKATDKNQRLLIGFDFPFGYPVKAYSDFKSGNTKCKNWKNLWNLISNKIEDNPRNKNNCFDIANKHNLYFEGDGPFWGRNENHTQYENINTNQPERFKPPINDPLQFRTIENYITNAKSVWQLAYSGCVGAQTLMGIPTLQKLKDCTNCVIWPFEKTNNKNKHVIVEIYPSIWKNDEEDKRNLGLVKDAGQVKTVAEQIFCHDRDGTLQNLLDVPCNHTEADIITKKEGWILGIKEDGEVADMITCNRPHLLYV